MLSTLLSPLEEQGNIVLVERAAFSLKKRRTKIKDSEGKDGPYMGSGRPREQKRERQRSVS